MSRAAATVCLLAVPAFLVVSVPFGVAAGRATIRLPAFAYQHFSDTG